MSFLQKGKYSSKSIFIVLEMSSCESPHFFKSLQYFICLVMTPRLVESKPGANNVNISVKPKKLQSFSLKMSRLVYATKIPVHGLQVDVFLVGLLGLA